jgi:hypothetical protein
MVTMPTEASCDYTLVHELVRATVRIDRARECGEKLRGDKGINFPDSALRLPAFTLKDIEDLEFVVRHADMVSLSFANSAADVELLQQHLKRLGGEKLGVILKIGTRRGFENLPDMLFAAAFRGRVARSQGGRTPHAAVILVHRLRAGNWPVSFGPVLWKPDRDH